MVALAYTDITPVAPVAPARPALQVVKKPNRRPVSAASDPVVDMTARLFSAPLHQMYALLWRAGVLSIDV